MSGCPTRAGDLTFASSAAFDDHLVSGSRLLVAAAGWASGAGSAGFSWFGQGGQGGGETAKTASGAGGGDGGRGEVFFPGQPVVGDQVAGEADLGVGDGDDPGPRVGLFGGAWGRGGPGQVLFEEPVGVFDAEPAQVGPPDQVQVQRVGSGGPQPQGLGRAGVGA